MRHSKCVKIMEHNHTLYIIDNDFGSPRGGVWEKANINYLSRWYDCFWPLQTSGVFNFVMIQRMICRCQ